jgi:small subunit ribosomal protein S18
MARNNDRDRGTKRAPKDDRRRGGKKKVCIFCTGKTEWVDYKDVNVLRRFMSDRGKIRARRVTGNCAQHQRDVAVAIKTARELALLPYTQRTVTERGGGRGPGRGGPPRGERRDEAPASVELLDDVLDPDLDLDLDAEADLGEIGDLVDLDAIPPAIPDEDV